MSTSKAKLLTAADLLHLSNQGVRGELIRGVFCETMSTGMEHGEIAVALASELRGFVRPRRLGRVAGTDIGIVLECNPDTVREPDVAYFSAERLLLDVRVSGYVDVAPDIVAEIISPRDRPAEVNSKTRMWLSYGVAIVWEIHPLEHEIMVHRSGMPTVTLTENDTLDGGEVLPGFTCPVREIFDF